MVVYLLVLCLGGLCDAGPTLTVWVSAGQCQTAIERLKASDPLAGPYKCRPEWVQGVIPGE